MKTKKKISIIGAGISGCAVASVLKEDGFDVSIYEKKNKIGGTFLDIKNKNETFFNGPQYLYKKSKWLKNLRKLPAFKNDFNDFKSYKLKNEKFNVYRSYTDLYGEVVTNNLFASPVTNLKYSKIYLNKFESLVARLECYQKNIYLPLDNWCRKISKFYENLHYKCAEILNIGRIYFAKDKLKIRKLKNNNNQADNILGLPLHDKEYIFTVPKKGATKFLQKFQNYLNKKIKVHYNSKISVIKNNTKIDIFNNGKKISTDIIIWAANPVPLLKNLGYGNLDNPVTLVKVYCANIKILNKLNNKNFYIQVFSNKTNIFRIYIYELNGKFKITVETFFEKDKVIDDKIVKKILNKFNVKIKFKSKFLEFKEVRHNLMTVNDNNLFNRFEKDFKRSNIIGGGWHLTGREQKINYILEKVKNKNA